MASMAVKERQSNGELVRLLCMFMIVMHHFIVHALYTDTLGLKVYTWDQQLVLAFHCFIYIGVNCFVLLSGWFSIRLKPRSVLNLWLICLFYAILGFIEIVIGNAVLEKGVDLFSWKYICPVLFPFSNTERWFIVCYVALMLFSPVLNAAIDTFDQRKFRWALILSSVMSIWFGYLWQVGQMNPSGYTTIQFFWLYLIGAYLRRYCTADWLKLHRYHCAGLYVICSILWGVLTMLDAHLGQMPFWYPFTYCNPLVMGASIGFFLFMMSFEFKSRIVNWLSASVLAVYLVQEGLFRYHWLSDYSCQWSSVFKILLVPVLSIGFMLAVLLLDKVRILLMKPVFRFYDSYLEPKISRYN